MITHTKWREDRRLKKENSYKLSSQAWLTDCHPVELRKWKKSNLNLPAKLIYSAADPTIVCRKSPKPQLGHHWPIFRRSWWWGWILTSNQCLTSCHDVILKHILRILLSFTNLWTQLGQLRKMFCLWETHVASHRNLNWGFEVLSECLCFVQNSENFPQQTRF